MTPAPTIPQLNAPNRVLIIKPSSLGDVVTALPILRALRRKFPQVHIAWMLSTACADLLHDDKDVDEIILFDRKKLGKCWCNFSAAASLWKFRRHLRTGNYDWVIDLQGLLRSAIFTRWTKAKLRVGFAHAREGAPWFYNLKVATAESHTIEQNIAFGRELGLDADASDMTLNVSAENQAYADEFFCSKTHNLTRGEFLVCVPPTRWETKKYPVRLWRKVISAVSEKIPVVLLGSPADSERQMCADIARDMNPAKVIDMAGQTRIPQMVAIIAASRGVVCSDSAAKFIAPAVGVDCVTLLGPTRMELTGPYPKGRGLVADVPCQGCLKKRCGHITCMQSIKPQTVIDAAMNMIESRNEQLP
ncbi:MAG: glycosyltransferase family 9 protein [Phycisphaerae bacterium]|nr:glycosyltransferase family 9 protein [Phycisphaerae bacterium]